MVKLSEVDNIESKLCLPYQRALEHTHTPFKSQVLIS